ncbi:MAG: CRTAC1 family protein, partial [Chitinophagaceae bacterium]
VGEWMAPRIFSFNGKSFTELKGNLDVLHGLWQSVAAADLDGDGDEDLILGNIGENFYLQPAKDKPVKLWLSDFDGNGTGEKIITRTINGKDAPVFLKKEVTDQIASLRKQNLKYVDFAKKSMQELFAADVLKNTLVKEFTYNITCIAFNDGNGNFTVQALPPQVQFSSVNAIVCTDVNGDGKTDLVMGGNNFETLPQFSRLDASYGHVLLNRGNRSFQWLSPAASGLEIRGVVRDIVAIKNNTKQSLLFLQNDDYPLFYNINTSQKKD